MTSVARKNMLCWVLPLFLWPVLCFSQDKSSASSPPISFEEVIDKSEADYLRRVELLKHSTGTARVKVKRLGGEKLAASVANQYRAIGKEPSELCTTAGNTMEVHWHTKGENLRYDIQIGKLNDMPLWEQETTKRIATNGKVGIYHVPLDKKAYVNRPSGTIGVLTGDLDYFEVDRRYGSINRRPFEGMRMMRESGVKVSLETVSIDGVDCVHALCLFPENNDSSEKKRTEYWFAIPYNYALKRAIVTRTFYKKSLVSNSLVSIEVLKTYDATYEPSTEYPDLWILKSLRQYAREYYEEELTIDFEDVHLGVDVPDATFTFEGIGVPQGTPIFDRRTSGKSAVYHYVPGVHVGLDRIDLAAGEIPQNPVQDSGCPEGPPAFSQDKSSASSPPISFEEVIDKSEADYLRRVELLKHSTGTVRVKAKHFGSVYLVNSLSHEYRAMGIEPSELRTKGGNTKEIHWHTKGENLRYDIQIGKLDEMPLWEQETIKRIATNGKIKISHDLLNGKAYVKGDLNSALNSSLGTLGNIAPDLDCFEVDQNEKNSARLPFDGMRTMRERGVKVSLETVSIDGVDCVHALCLFPEKADGSEKKITEIWFAIPCNYAIKRVIGTRTFYINGLAGHELRETYDATYERSKEYPDLWILKSLHQYAHEMEQTKDFENVHLGVDVPDATFTFEGIGVPQGTPIFDRRTSGKSAVYHYVPGVHVGLDRIDLAAGEIPQSPVQDSGCPEGPPEKQPGVPPPASAPPH